MHIFHKWNVIHFEEIDSKRGWFKHQRCNTCGKEKMISGMKFFATISDAIELGIIKGIYHGFHPKAPRD